MDVELLAEVLKGQFELDLVPEDHWRQVVVGLAFLHEVVTNSFRTLLVLRILLRLNQQRHFFVATFAHFASVDEVAGFVLDSLLVYFQGLQRIVAALLKVFLGLRINVKPMRHGRPFGPVDELLGGPSALFFEACNPHVDVQVIYA